MIDKRTQGRRNRQAGAAWERKVRADLEKKGWIVTKFQSNVEFETKAEVNKDLNLKLNTEKGHLIPAKPSRFRLQSTGFPDFLCWRQGGYEFMGVEAKSNGYLNKLEKAKCEWLIKNDIIPKILIAKKKREGRKVIPSYTDFVSKWKKIVISVSGGFDPLHIGHIESFREAKKLGDYLVVILNNDNWLKKKKKYVFMEQSERMMVLKAIKYVDEVILTSHKPHDLDNSVCLELEKLKPDIFANGGDRKADNIPEYDLCEKLGIKMIFNVGGDKVQSSSWLVNEYERHKKIMKNLLGIDKLEKSIEELNILLSFHYKVLNQALNKLNPKEGSGDLIKDFLDETNKVIITNFGAKISLYQKSKDGEPDIYQIQLGKKFMHIEIDINGVAMKEAWKDVIIKKVIEKANKDWKINKHGIKEPKK